MFELVLNVVLLGLVRNSCSLLSQTEDELFEFDIFYGEPTSALWRQIIVKNKMRLRIKNGT